ncbi:MAG: branched-chain amino acid ABC transporter permease [Bdellovibrionales bacterium]
MTATLRSLSLWLSIILLIWLFDIFGSQDMNPYYFSIVMYAGINVIMAVSLNLVNGFTGQFSMGHAGFMAVGAYGSAYITTTLQTASPEMMTGTQATLIFLISLFVGGGLAALAGYIVGLPSLRLSGDYLAIVTLGFGEIIRVVLLNMNVVGGARGMPSIPALSSFGWVYTFMVITIFVVWRLLKSAHGRAFLSVREDEIAAQSMGVNTTTTKVRAFVLSAFFAGIGGGLFAHYLRFINPSTFDLNRSFEIIIMVVMGGMGSVTGSVIAGASLTILREGLRELQQVTLIDLRMVIYSLLLIILMLTRPTGLFGTKELPDLFERFRKKSGGQN